MNDQTSMIFLGIAFLLVGVSILIKTWTVDWADFVRAMILQRQTER